MKNSSGFSYTLSAVVFVAVISLLLGYLAGRRVAARHNEGFADSGSCNVCNQPKPSCACKAACPVKCPSCNKCAGNCDCPSSISSVDDVTGPSKMNKVRARRLAAMDRRAGGIRSRLDDDDYPPSRSMGRRGSLGGSGPMRGPLSVSPPTGLPEKCPPPPPCPVPDPTKYVLKSTVPPCPPMPDLSRYMLKTECPPQPDMSKYVLKSSVPKCPPCISSCSKPCKIGECPPCPRPRCPIVQCPEPKPCPACPQVQVAPCPEPRVQCKAQYETESKVRPMLASTAAFGL